MALPLARDALLVATGATAAYASSVQLLDAAQPAPQTPLLALRLQQHPHVLGPERVGFLPTLAPALVAQSPLDQRDAVTPAAPPAQAGLVVSAASNKPALAVHSFQSSQQLAQLFLPSPITCLSLNRIHSLLAVGLPEGSISVWDIRSGEMLANAFDAHYQPVSLLRWTDDGQALLSGGQDGRVCIFTLSSILDPASASASTAQPNGLARVGGGSSAQPLPWTILTDHTLCITALEHTGSFPGQLWSASDDGTVKRWNLSTRRVISTFAFPLPITNIQVDDLGRYFLASTRPAGSATSGAAARGGGKEAQRTSSLAPSASGVPIDQTADPSLLPGSNTLYRVDLYRKPAVSSADAGKALAHTHGGSSSKRKRRHEAGGGNMGLSTLPPEPVGALGPHGVHRIVPSATQQHETSTHHTASAPGSTMDHPSSLFTSLPAAQAQTQNEVQLAEPITALTLLPGGSHAYLGTGGAKLHLLDLSTMRIVRTISLVDSLTASGTRTQGTAHQLPPVTSLIALRTPADLQASVLGGSSSTGGHADGTAGAGAGATAGGGLGARDGLPSSAISPVQQSTLRCLRESNRPRFALGLPVFAHRLERTTRAYALTHGLPVPPERPIRLSGAVNSFGAAQRIAPGFFSSLFLPGTVHADDGARTPAPPFNARSSMLGGREEEDQEPEQADDIVLLDSSVEDQEERKGHEYEHKHLDGLGPGHGLGDGEIGAGVLRHYDVGSPDAQVAHLEAGLADAKYLNDQLWTRVQALEAQLGPSASAR